MYIFDIVEPMLMMLNRDFWGRDCKKRINASMVSLSLFIEGERSNTRINSPKYLSKVKLSDSGIHNAIVTH